jgi:hypothetical protein
LNASDANASRAHAARFNAAPLTTVERAPKLKREELLAQSLLTREEKRAGDAPLLQHPAQSLLRALIPDERVEHKLSLKSEVWSLESGV